LEGRVLSANRAFARKFGRSAEQLDSTPAVGFVHPDDAPTFRSDPLPAGQRVAREQRWLTPQGWRWVSWEESALVDNEAHIVGTFAVGHDITRQHLAEEQYVKLSAVVEQSPLAIAIADAEGHAQYVNTRFTEVTGLTLEQILDRDLPILREGHKSDTAYEEFWATVTAGQEWRGELTRSKPDGSKVWESVQVFPLHSAGGEITNFVSVRQDVTAGKRLEEQLRQAQKMEVVGTLAGGIAHDFNNLLAVINGYAEFSLSHSPDSAMLLKSLSEIQRAAQRASGLVRQILTFSRKAETRFSAMDLNQLVRDLVTPLCETFPRTVSFSFDLQENLPPLLADPNQIQQIILNLCVNARDAMPSGGTITINTDVRPGTELAAFHLDVQTGRKYAMLKVTDTGTGMSPEVRARIFEPFFTTKQGSHGTGLGLAVVYGIVTGHSGFIDVDSTLGVGTSFRVYLPLADDVVASPVAAAATNFPCGTETLLIVDDEISLRRLLETAFTRKGYHVTCAADGLEAIEIISDTSRPVDAVLLDLNMPGATGMDVFKVIRVCRPELKVLVLSGHLSPQARVEFEHLGQKDFVGKPYSLNELGHRLRTLLDTPKPTAS
jgi:PAS domain S-box-containing protein